MSKRARDNRRFRGGRAFLLPALLLCALTMQFACGAPAGASPSPAPSATPAPTAMHDMRVHVIQTIRNEWTGRQTETICNLPATAGESHTVQNESGSWALTFTVLGMEDGVARIRTDHRMRLLDGDGTQYADVFEMPFGDACRIEEPVESLAVRYVFTFYAPLVEGEPAQRFTNRHILGNIRRALHNSEKSAFSEDELELILFVELKGSEVEDIEELQYLTSLETLTLKETRVEDLSPIAGCERLSELKLLENSALDYTTMPALPSLRTLSLTGDHTQEDIQYLKTLLPGCSIVTD